jgi:hypothetical protein
MSHRHDWRALQVSRLKLRLYKVVRDRWVPVVEVLVCVLLKMCNEEVAVSLSTYSAKVPVTLSAGSSNPSPADDIQSDSFACSSEHANYVVQNVCER